MSDKSKASAVCMRSCLCGSQVDVGLAEWWRALPRSVKVLIFFVVGSLMRCFVADESVGESDDAANSTSSSYSSLSDLVTDIQNSEISGDTPGQ